MSQSDYSEIEAYNYSVFEGQGDFLGFRTSLQVGSKAPDFGATLLGTGERMRLSDFWGEGDVVVEFGSLT